MSYCSRSCRRRFTVLNFKRWAFSRICGRCQQHLYCARAETVFMHFRCRFRHRLSIRRPRFPIEVQNFGDFLTLIFEFNILNVCRISTSGLFDLLTYKVYHTRRAEVKFEVYITIHCRVIAFLSADTSRDFVTLTFDLLTLNSCTAWRVTWPTLLPSSKILHLSVLDLWVITFPLVTIENPYAANAHAPNHVTRE